MKAASLAVVAICGREKDGTQSASGRAPSGRSFAVLWMYGFISAGNKLWLPSLPVWL